MTSKFRKATGTLDAVAQRALAWHNWNLDEAVKAYNENPNAFKTGKKKRDRRKKGKKSSNTVKAEPVEETHEESVTPVLEESKSTTLRDKDKADAIFSHYANKETQTIDSNGLLQLYTDLGISLTDVATIIFPYYCSMIDFVLPSISR